MDRFNIGGVCAARYRSQNRTNTAKVKASSYLRRYLAQVTAPMMPRGHVFFLKK